jgi:tetratricopeptide (TPR) repeat protein
MKLFQAFCAVLLIGLLAAQASAETDFDRCTGGDGYDIGKKIAACTLAISSGKLDQTNLAAAYSKRAAARASLKDLDGAVADFGEVIRLFPDLASAYLSRGGIYYSQKKFGDAVRDYADAVRLRPDWIIALKYLGDAHDENGEPAKAIAVYQRALKLDRNFADVHFDLGIV